MTWAAEDKIPEPSRGLLAFNLSEDRAACPRCGYSGVPKRTRLGGELVHVCPVCDPEHDEIVAELEREEELAAAREKHGKIGRNDPCFCGSGLKAKKCHLR